MRGQPLVCVFLLCAALALAVPVAHATPGAHTPGPEAAPAPGTDPQATEQAVWEEVRKSLGLSTDAPQTVETSPAPAGGSEQAPQAGPAPAAGPTSEGDVLPEVNSFYQELQAKPPALPPGVTAYWTTGPAAPAAGPGSGDEAAETTLILNLALRYWGVPYRWGGANRGGVDCSGLIIRAAADGGTPGLPHSAAELWKIGRRVAKAEMQPGDLVFFKNTYKPGVSHVGILSRGTTFLQASSRKGKVTMGDLTDPYWIRHWAGARRWDFLKAKKGTAAERR